MQSTVLLTLEFDRVREALARVASTPLGRARALGLEPLSDPEAVGRGLLATVEAVAFTKRHSLDLDAPEDLADVLGTLEVFDQPLSPSQLVGLARFVESVERVAGRITAAAAEAGSAGAAGTPFPHLGGIAERTPSFAEETAAVRRAIDPGGDVLDNASPALREIRDQLRRQRAKLRSTLDALTRARDTAKYLQDQVVTDRNGRYVVVVRAEHRDAIPGVVHGGSASGASLYVEPMSTVGLNNDVVALVEREREEIFRILSALSNAFRGRAADLEALLDAAADIDELAAKSRLARRVDGIAPALASDGRVEFLGARHPLLLPAMRDLIGPESSATPDSERLAGTPPSVVVASDLIVRPPARALVISGPNTGGKTVALKAMGLLSLMAQAGLLVPVEAGSAFTPFRSVFADIGDEQSISASLSTFSARIANLVAMERALESPALVLLDEVGSGTDPIEGGALGTAVIDHFRRRGATVVATTHDDALKSYAATTEGVRTAAFGFHAETYAPTYRLIYGAPGRSLAIEIAQRLGMPEAVIADARERRSARESLLSAHLARVDRELASIQLERDGLARERQHLQDEQRRLLDKEARIAEREAVVKKRSDDRLNEKLREARAEVDRIVGQLKEKAVALANRVERGTHDVKTTVPSTGDVGQLRAGARAALSAVGEAAGLTAADAAPAVLESRPVPGQTVFVPAFDADGVVATVQGSRVEVDLRGKRIRMKVADLRRARTTAGLGAAQAPDRPQGRSEPRRSSENLIQAPREIVLIGSTVDLAVDRVEKFLNEAMLADERRVRLIHGRGTGRLREGLHEFLEEHPLVASVERASPDEGGDAATIVLLKD